VTGIRKGTEIATPNAPRCQRCFKPIKEDGHNGMCSSDCAEAAREDLSQGALRKLAFSRDQGRCFSCNAETETERAEIDQMRAWLANPTTSDSPRTAWPSIATSAATSTLRSPEKSPSGICTTWSRGPAGARTP
jgi:hypothetical protein